MRADKVYPSEFAGGVREASGEAHHVGRVLVLGAAVLLRFERLDDFGRLRRPTPSRGTRTTAALVLVKMIKALMESTRQCPFLGCVDVAFLKLEMTVFQRV